MVTDNMNLTTGINDDTVIWRYMDFVSFYSMVTEEAIFFRRLDRYPDGFEGTLPDNPKRTIFEYYRCKVPDTEAQKTSEGYAFGYTVNKALTICNSWTINNDENDEMWNKCLHGSKEGIAIKSTVGKLKGSLINSKYKRKMFFDKVDYVYDEKKMSFDEIKIHPIVTTKKKCYSFEKEYRAYIFGQYKGHDKNGIPIPLFTDGESISNIDFKMLIDKIYVSSFTEDWFYRSVKKVVKDHLKYFVPENIICSSIKK